MDTRTLGSELQRARKSKNLRQVDVAHELHCDRHLISDWERGWTQPDRAARRELARYLGISCSLLDSLYIPPLPALGRTPDAFCSHKPRYLPVGDKPPWQRLLALFRTSREVYDGLYQALMQREDSECVRRFLIKTQSDAKHESKGWMELLNFDMSPSWLAPQRCGYRDLPVIDPASYQVVGDCRVPCLVRGGQYPAVIFIQNTLLTRSGGPLRPDGLVGVKFNGTMRWCAGEFDGEGYVGYDNGRESHLRMPVVRYSVKELWTPGFPELYWRRIHAALGIPQ